MLTKTLHRNYVLRNSLLIVSCFAIFYSASSASFTTGGGKKKSEKKSTISNLNLKNNPLSFNNGYRFRSGLSFTQNNSTSLVMQSNTIRFQKGNNLYVLPVKQKVIFSKFKTPQKEMK